MAYIHTVVPWSWHGLSMLPQWTILKLCLVYVVLGLEPGTLCMLGKHFTELQPSLYLFGN